MGKSCHGGVSCTTGPTFPEYPDFPGLGAAMESGAHLQLKNVGDVVDEGALKVLLEGFKQDQLLSHCLQLPVTLRGKKGIF